MRDETIRVHKNALPLFYEAMKEVTVKPRWIRDSEKFAHFDCSDMSAQGVYKLGLMVAQIEAEQI